MPDKNKKAVRNENTTFFISTDKITVGNKKIPLVYGYFKNFL